MASSADGVEKIADAGCSELVLIYGANRAHCRTVLHAGFAGVQDDIVVFMLGFERCGRKVVRASRTLFH